MYRIKYLKNRIELYLKNQYIPPMTATVTEEIYYVVLSVLSGV